MAAEGGHAVVTGGAGFLGSHLCECLLRKGYRVSCLDSFATGTPRNVARLESRPGFRLVQHDVTDPFPDVGRAALVLHLASAASPKDYARLPIETLRAGAIGTANALEFAGRHGARFVLTSTSEVYGDPLEHPQRETYWGNVNPIGPRSVYDEAKRYAEALTMAHHRQYGADVGIARIFNTYGPRMRADDGRMIPNFITQALAGEPLTVAGTGRQTRSVCYVDDTVAGLLALAESTVPGPVNIGNPHELSVRHIADEIRALSGSRSPVTSIPGAVDDPRRRCPDISVALSLLGWQPEVTLREGLRRTIDWFAAERGAAA
ncbi:UDP-glucuronic acid decarboxylase family protein [Prauserella muralis]|uniref:Epimerase n=1 Tax=Prauserella muralis TaxID=588067 RepID=A0A2V4AZM4_9PSEU|nr:UDP-glucuronic acid decarboxylase family protein [Prauserella muralis]PXY27322.1 epimerase [Prauserella muralis]TWE22998.1 dTDP-glucose 4,6-dehydratase [Prauserella muralis]